jgi:phage shock protein A
MNLRTALSTVTLLAIVHVVLPCGGCAGPQRSVEERPEREFGGAAAGERITREELDGLTLAFADRYVGLVYSVCHDVKENNPDPAQRGAAQVLLADNAANIYDIASNADPFTRMLDLVVVTTLVSQVWEDDGRAVAVFGQRGQKLADALVRAREEAWTLAARVLTPDQLDTLRSLLLDWHRENPDMVRASFVRFSNFAIGRNRSAAADVLEARGLFAEVGQAGQAVDEARLLGDRIFHWLKRAPTLLRWQISAMKDEVVATPELDTALADIHRVTDQIEQLPANVVTEREAILKGVDERLQNADKTIANVRGALDQADGFADSLKPLIDSLEQMLQTAGDLIAHFDAKDQSKTESRSRPFDIREYEQAVKEVTKAAKHVDALLKRTEHLLGSPELENRMQDVNESVDESITTAADQSQIVIDAFFWRACALLVVLFVLLILYRLIVFLFLRDRNTTN